MSNPASGGGKGGRGGRPPRAALSRWRHLRGENLELYLFLIYSVHGGWALPIGGAAPRTFAPVCKNPRAATESCLQTITQFYIKQNHHGGRNYNIMKHSNIYRPKHYSYQKYLSDIQIQLGYTVVRSVVELRWGPRGPGPPERPGGPRETSVLRGFKGACKRPPEIAR